MIKIISKIVVIVLAIMSMSNYIFWVISKDDYYYKQAIWFMLLTMANMIV
jgi:hypothetical protein